MCVVSQQGRVQRDSWERRGGGRALGPAKLTETVATNGSVCVTASVVSAVWLQVTIWVHVCLCACVCVCALGSHFEHHCGVSHKMCLCVCVFIHSCANIHLCVFFLEDKIKALLMHKM